MIRNAASIVTRGRPEHTQRRAVLGQELTQRRAATLACLHRQPAHRGRGDTEQARRREDAQHRREPEQRARQQPALAPERAGGERQQRQPVVAQRRARPVGAEHVELVRAEHGHRDQHRQQAEAGPHRPGHRQEQHRVDQPRRRQRRLRRGHVPEDQARQPDPRPGGAFAPWSSIVRQRSRAPSRRGRSAGRS